MRERIDEALAELERIASGTMTAVPVFETTTFTCACGQLNTRASHLFKIADYVNCIREGCTEQYKVEKIADDIFFQRRSLPIRCHKCGAEDGLQYRAIMEMPKDSIAVFECNVCGHKNRVMWQLKQVEPASPQAPG